MNPIKEYHNISYSQLSIARHYGAIDVNGSRYYYYPNEDKLVREDVVKQLKRTEQELSKQKKQAIKEQQVSLL